MIRCGLNAVRQIWSLVMLSFLREQIFEGAGDDPGRNSSQQEPPAAADMHTGKDSEHTQNRDYITVAAKSKKNVRKSTILLAALFCAGLLCLWFMIKKSTPAPATAATVGKEESKIETAISQLTGVRAEMFNRMDEIVNKFYQFSDVQQVEVGELARNPFRYDISLDNVRVGDSGTDAAVMQEQMREQTKDIELLSIMRSDEDGTGQCCMIDDKILYEGDLIRGFRIRRIGDNSVTLEWETDQLEGSATGPKNGEERLEAQIILKLSE
jgi:preprotein translocase subunit SecG